MRVIVWYKGLDLLKEFGDFMSKEWLDVIEVICWDFNIIVLWLVEVILLLFVGEVIVFCVNFEIGDWWLVRGFFNDLIWYLNVIYLFLYCFFDNGR